MAKIKPSQVALAVYELTQGSEEKEIKKILESLVKYLAEKKMLRQAGRILKALDKIYAEREGVYELVVESAHSLDDKQLKTIEKNYLKSLGAKKITIQEKISRELLGGYKISVMDEVTDRTLASAVSQLSRSLLTVKK